MHHSSYNCTSPYPILGLVSTALFSTLHMPLDLPVQLVTAVEILTGAYLICDNP